MHSKELLLLILAAFGWFSSAITNLTTARESKAPLGSNTVANVTEPHIEEAKVMNTLKANGTHTRSRLTKIAKVSKASLPSDITGVPGFRAVTLVPTSTKSNGTNRHFRHSKVELPQSSNQDEKTWTAGHVGALALLSWAAVSMGAVYFLALRNKDHEDD